MTPKNKIARTVFALPIAADRLQTICHETYTGDQAEAVLWLYDTMLEQQWNYATAGKFINRDGSNISKIFNGKYSGNINTFIASINDFREQWILTNGVTTPGFVETRESKLIFHACDKARNNREIALIYGDLGAGKTTGGQEFCKRNPGDSHYFRLESSQAFGTFLRAFGRSLGLTHRTVDALRENIPRIMKRKKITFLFIDEFHLPFTTSYDKVALSIAEFIRDLHDILDCGVALCGTKVIPEKLKSNFWAKALEQIIDRGNTVVDLKKRTTASGLSQFFEYYGLPKKPSQEALKLINAILREHSLRKLVFALRDGSNAAAKMNHQYTWDHFVDAYVLNAELAGSES